MTWRAIAISAIAEALREGEGGGGVGVSGDPSLASSPAETGEDAHVGVGDDKNKNNNKDSRRQTAGSTAGAYTYPLLRTT